MALSNLTKKGLVPVIVQDGPALKYSWPHGQMRRALRLTADSGELTLWSRSRKELWRKRRDQRKCHEGLRASHRLRRGQLLAVVEPSGPACHTGKRCFYRSIWGKENSTEATFLGRLWRYLVIRKSEDPKESYTARLLAEGPSRVAQKVGEEGVETAIAAATGDRRASGMRPPTCSITFS